MPSNVTRVNISALRDAAQRGCERASRFEEALDRIEAKVSATDSFWEGEAAELYRSVFRQELARMRATFEQFASYPDALARHADAHERAERAAEEIANAMQQAQGFDVRVG